MSHPRPPPASGRDIPRVVVIGVGNPFRQDDGAGVHVVRALAREAPTGARLVESDGEATRLVDAWEGADLAVVVDAVHTHAAPSGTIHRIEVHQRGVVPDARLTRGAGSSHVLGPGDAVALAAALDRLPPRLLIVGIEGEQFGFGIACSPAVTAACATAAALVRAEVTAAGRRLPQGRNGEE